MASRKRSLQQEEGARKRTVSGRIQALIELTQQRIDSLTLEYLASRNGPTVRELEITTYLYCVGCKCPIATRFHHTKQNEVDSEEIRLDYPIRKLELIEGPSGTTVHPACQDCATKIRAATQ